MTSYPEALSIILSEAKSYGKETILLNDALDRILDEHISANRDYPPFNRSAMDGIAINIADFEKGIRSFEISETIYAGQKSNTLLNEGQCYKIMTGAAVPAAANAVIRNEDILFSENNAKTNSNHCLRYQNISQKGQDLKAGDTVLAPGQKINPSIIALLASLGKAEVVVKKLPTVAFFTTGNEVVPLNQEVSDVQIHNSNAHLLKALLKKQNVNPLYWEHILDDKALLSTALKKGLSCDIMIINGGVSAGDADFIPEILTNLGVIRLFHKVAIKPGKPFWCGKTPTGGMVFALPGNPFSCLVTFKLFVESYLNRCLGIAENVKSLEMIACRIKKSNLDEFFPAQIDKNRGLKQAEINGSGDIRLGLHANAIAFHPAEKMELSVNEIVNYIDL
jgi:molybdopterin molybdotransferase